MIKNVSLSTYHHLHPFSSLLVLGLGLEAFAKFLRVSVSLSKNLVLEKSLGFEKFGLGKKSRFRKIWSRKKSIGFGLGKIWSQKKVLVSENLVS